MSDLDKLIEAVELGSDDFVHSDSWIDAWQSFYPQPDSDRSNGTACLLVAWKAYNGSLDAAKSLHEALLPGWHWRADDGQGQEGPFWSVFRYTNKQWTETESHEGQADSAHASRSWLAAILKAYRSLNVPRNPNPAP